MHYGKYFLNWSISRLGKTTDIEGLVPRNLYGFFSSQTKRQRVKSSLSSRPITGSFWAGLATFLVTCPVDRLN